MRFVYFFYLVLLTSNPQKQVFAKLKPVFNENYFPTAENLIINAKKEIFLCMFQFSYYKDKPESYSNKLAEKLIEKAKQGVKIKILLESGEPFLGNDFYNSVQEISKILKHKNIEIKYDPRRKTTHAKFLVVDSKFVLLGSTNWTYYGLQENNESNVLIESQEVAETFKEYFNNLWNQGSKSSEAPSFRDKEIINKTGIAKVVEKKISKKGNPYTIIYLEDGMRVYIRGHQNIPQGAMIKIEGKLTTFRGKEQIEAYRVEVLKERR